MVVMSDTGLPRPHRLYVQQSTPVGKDANGFNLPPDVELVFWCACRGQTYGHGGERKGANGESYYYRHVVFVDLGTDFIKSGTRIEVRYNDGRVRFSGEAKEFSIESQHIRIWV